MSLTQGATLGTDSDEAAGALAAALQELLGRTATLGCQYRRGATTPFEHSAWDVAAMKVPGSAVPNTYNDQPLRRGAQYTRSRFMLWGCIWQRFARQRDRYAQRCRRW